MGRDVDIDAHLNDKTGPGNESVRRQLKQTSDAAKKDYDKLGRELGNSTLHGIAIISPRLARKVAESLGTGAQLGRPLFIAGISTALPALSGLIGAAVTGGAAGLGIVGGAVLASRDARVQAAGTNLGRTLLAGLTDRASSFVGPMLQGIDVVERKFVESGDAIKRIFSNSSKFVVPLTEALSDAGQSLIEGLDIAVSRAGPVMDSFNRGFRNTGETIKGFLDDMSANAEENAQVLDAAFSAINGTLATTGEVLSGVTRGFAFLDDVMPLSIFDTWNQLMGKTGESTRKTGEGTFGLSTSIQAAGGSAETAAEDTRLYEAALKENARAAQVARDAQMSLFGAATDVGQAMANAKKAVKENGQTLDSNTEKGRANRRAIDQLAGSLRNQYEQTLKANGQGPRTDAVAARNRASFIRLATQMTGSASKARALANSILGIPEKRNTTATMNAAGAAAQAANLRREILSIPKTRVSTITVAYRVTGSSAARSAVSSALNKQSLRFASGSFATTDGGSGSRTGGPVPVNVTAAVENTILLDGKPFRAYTDRTVADANRRQRWKQRTGGRY